MKITSLFLATDGADPNSSLIGLDIVWENAPSATNMALSPAAPPHPDSKTTATMKEE